MVAGLLFADRIGCPVEEEFEKGQRLDCGARLAGNDEEAAVWIQPLGLPEHCAWIGAVQDRQAEESILPAIDIRKELRSEARAAHAQQQGVGVAGLEYRAGEVFQAPDALLHVLGRMQPAESVRDFARFGRPDGVIVAPDARDDLLLLDLLQGLRYFFVLSPADTS